MGKKRSKCVQSVKSFRKAPRLAMRSAVRERQILKLPPQTYALIPKANAGPRSMPVTLYSEFE